MPYVHDNLAATLQAKGHSDEAIAEYLTSIGINDQVAQPHYNVACAYALQGDADRALQYHGRAIALNPPYRQKALTDRDFATLRTDERFVALVGTSPTAP